jgi:hypothetical protein
MYDVSVVSPSPSPSTRPYSLPHPPINHIRSRKLMTAADMPQPVSRAPPAARGFPSTRFEKSKFGGSPRSLVRRGLLGDLVGVRCLAANPASSEERGAPSRLATSPRVRTVSISRQTREEEGEEKGETQARGGERGFPNPEPRE